MLDQKKYLVYFSCYLKFGPVRLCKIKKFFHSWENAFLAGENEWATALNTKEALDFFAWRKEFDFNQILNVLKKESIGVLTIEDEEYPDALRNIYDPPFVLYVRGDISVLQKPLISMVGSRKFSTYGKSATQKIASELAQSGIAIVSGLAIGIDGIAHQSVLDVGGLTVAVLGSGVNDASIFPRFNYNLAQKIIQNGGLVISEFPPFTPAFKQNFPLRNRIVSGLSLGTVVVEAGEKSGSLITAYSALDQGRVIFAVPGSIFSPQSAGTNELIRKGAILTTFGDNVLSELGLLPQADVKQLRYIAQTPEEEKILNCLTEGEKHINDIVVESTLPTHLIGSTLSLLEINGAIKNIGNNTYSQL